MSQPTNAVRTEAQITLLAVTLLIVMLILVQLAKVVPNPKHALLLNEAKTEQFAKQFDIEKPLASRITEWREGQGQFQYTDQLTEIRLFSKLEAERVSKAWADTGKPLEGATSEVYAKVLGIPLALGERIFAFQTNRNIPVLSADTPEAHYAQSKSLFSAVTVLDGAKVRPLVNECLVRDADTNNAHFARAGILLVILLLLCPPLFRRKLGGDPYLLVFGVLLAGMGVVMLYSIKDPLRDSAAFENHTQGIVLSLIVFFVASRLRREARNRLRRYQYLWGLAAIVLMSGLFIFGTGPQGVRLTLFHFQPVEIIKILLIFFLASYLSERADSIADVSSRWRSGDASRKAITLQLPRKEDLGPVMVMYGFALLLFLIVKDMGPGLVLFATFMTMLYVLTARSSFLWLGAALLLLGGFLSYTFHLGVFGTRVDMWLHPFMNSHPNGMQLAQGIWGMATGGLEGSGLGLGMPSSIPRSGSDLAFASWAEETGWIGTLFLLCLYVLLVWRGTRIALHASTAFDRALAMGLTLLLGLQTLVIIGGVVGLLPLSGISLPFLSYGNSALVAHFFILGVLRGISAGGSPSESLAPDVVTRSANRFMFSFAVAVLGIVGVVRLGTLQLVRATYYATLSIRTPDADGEVRAHVNPRLLAIERGITRGSIYDRNGKVLATSRPEEIKKNNTNEENGDRLIRLKARYYPYGSATAHLVGYTEGTGGGSAGLEKGYENELRGFTNYAELLQDYRSRSLPGFRTREGKNLTLTIDADFQKRVASLLEETTHRLKDKKTGKSKTNASFVMVEPATGDVLALISLPSFDPNGLTQEQIRTYSEGEDAKQESRLLNRAVSGLYPPGSTFKVATTMAALSSGIDPMQFRVLCNQIDPMIKWRAQGLSYVRRNTRDDKGDPRFGSLNLPAAFTVSSNIYFAHLSTEIGAERFREIVHSRLHFRYTPSVTAFSQDLPDLGYGQGRMLVTPLEMARLSATVANEGKMMEPRYVMAIKAPHNTDVLNATGLEPHLLSEATSVAHARKIREYMRSVVERGTARGVFNDLGLEVAGKTGTAQNGRADGEPHSWFIGFAPCESTETIPKYAFACVVENGGYGKRVAAVVCRKTLEALNSNP